MSSPKKMTPVLEQPGVTEEVQTTTDEFSNTTPPSGPSPTELIAVFAAKWPLCFFRRGGEAPAAAAEDPFSNLWRLRPRRPRRDPQRACRLRQQPRLPAKHEVPGAERIGLHGKPCWKVSNEEAEAAGNRIKSRQDCLERQRKRLHAANAEKPRLSLGRRS